MSLPPRNSCYSCIILWDSEAKRIGIMIGFNISGGSGNFFGLWGKFSFVQTLCGITLVMCNLAEDFVEAARHFLSAPAWDLFLSKTRSLSWCIKVPDHHIRTREEQILYHLRKVRFYQKINIKSIHNCENTAWATHDICTVLPSQRVLERFIPSSDTEMQPPLGWKPAAIQHHGQCHI